VYDLKGNYDHTLDHYKQAHKILVNRGIIGRTELATVYGNMGVVYNKKGEYLLALDCQQKCLEIEKQFSSK
jgi:tetratricopeptide (TPR) repeat protein